MSYPVSVCLKVRRLREAGFSAAAIHRVLIRDGSNPAPSVTTIKRWIRDDAGARHFGEDQRRRAAESRARKAGGRVLRINSLSPEFRAARFTALIETVGLSPEDAAAVMRFDAPDHALIPEVFARDVAA